MNKPSADRARLLAELKHGDWTTGHAAGFARVAAAHARRRQVMKRATAVAGCLAAALALTFVSLRPPASSLARNTTPPPAAFVSSRNYEIISDTELLRLVNDRPLLVINTDSGRIIRSFGQ